MTTEIAALIEMCRSKAADLSDYDPVLALLLSEAADKIESLQSYVAWREQLLRDATRYFDFGDDDAVAYYKALERQKLIYKYGENINPAHKKEPKLPALDAAIEAEAARYRYLRDHHDYTINNMAFGCELKDVELILSPLYAKLFQPAVDRSALDGVVDFQIGRQRRRDEQP